VWFTRPAKAGGEFTCPDERSDGYLHVRRNVTFSFTRPLKSAELS
jgi:hypothetical protein